MVSQLTKPGYVWRVALTMALFTPSIAVPVSDTSGHEVCLDEVVGEFVLRPGDPSLARWRLPVLPPSERGAATTDSLINLGRSLFFDEQLSADRNRSCASCHRPELGWSDGLPTAVSLKGEPLARATPTLFNAAYGTIFMWDGRAASLEEQAMGPVFNPDEMGSEPGVLFARLSSDTYYQRAFEELFPEEPINEESVSLALAAFQRTLVVRNSRFDQWVAGDHNALTAAEVRGFAVFLDPERGSCGTCHAPPNFTDDGFHNIGLKSFANENPDPGRFEIRPVRLMRGAFKTPTLRNIGLTAPYFHDGSAQTLEDVVEHYIDGGDVKDNLSPEMKAIKLDAQEKADLVAFLRALTETPGSTQPNSINLASDR